jgi:2-dehydropantoate 2-reductase
VGTIHHLNDVHQISFGPRQTDQKERVDELAKATFGAGFDAVPSENIILDMWEKWVFLATLAGMTCLTRASVGDIVAAGGLDLTESLLDECRAIAKHAGWSVRPEFMARAHAVLTANGSPMMASMLGDLERGGPTEAEHILGDLLHRRESADGPDRSLLLLAHVAISAYAHRLARQKGNGK